MYVVISRSDRPGMDVEWPGRPRALGDSQARPRRTGPCGRGRRRVAALCLRLHTCVITPFISTYVRSYIHVVIANRKSRRPSHLTNL